MRIKVSKYAPVDRATRVGGIVALAKGLEGGGCAYTHEAPGGETIVYFSMVGADGNGLGYVDLIMTERELSALAELLKSRAVARPAEPSEPAPVMSVRR